VNHSYTISFEINDLIFSTSSSYIIICFLLFFIIIYFLQTIYFKTKFSLSKYKIKKIITNKDRGYNSFVNGMIALANRDYKQASKESIKISKYLKDNKSLNLLLKSEIYKVEKKYEKLNLIYEEMSHNSHTQNLGYRGLMEHYLRSQDYHHAFIYGEKLFNNNPNIEKIYETLVNIIGKTNHWQQLLNVSDRAYSNKIINKDLYSINKSIAFYEIAKIKKLSSSKESLDLIEKALKLNKNFPPFVMLYFELLIKNNKHDFAKKLIKKIWEVYPHPPYKDIIRELSKSLDIGLESLVRYITESSINRVESKILLTEASIESKHWSEARKQIVSLLDHQPNKEICLLMSKIEEGESNDPQKVNAWILRSNNGDLSKVWVCQVTHMVQKEWSSVSESGYFNSLVWRDPPMLNNLQKLNIM
jgi:uncharacterized membrane-anchored protein